MSAIGPGTLGALNVAGSAAGAQHSQAHVDRTREESAQRTFQVDQQLLSSRDVDDVAETLLSRDRDADGRLPYEPPAEGSAEDEETTPPSSKRSPDAFGERGRALDLEA
ncbi:MAG TPA: hypothetical protein EYP14_11305 [Planctomycetaceae bacterium]|nr:hypothetical protein [Planctomycetaceae bacterium]